MLQISVEDRFLRHQDKEKECAIVPQEPSKTSHYRVTGNVYITVIFFMESISELHYILLTAQTFWLKELRFTLHYLDRNP